MNNASDLFGGGGSKPKLITPYASGAGTHIPTVDMARCFVRLQAGGGGGWASAGSVGGGGGAMVEAWIRIPIAGLAYVVGAGGAVSVSGSPTTFGQLKANPGTTPVDVSNPGWGGLLAMLYGSVTATAASMVTGGVPSGVGGGGGGASSVNGQLVSFPGMADAANNYVASPTSTNLRSSNGVGNSSGGNSFYGKGNPNNTAPVATAYGAGGGANAAGSGGYIEIWDFGA